MTSPAVGRRRPGLARWLLLLGSSAAALGLAEWWLRAQGFEPGFIPRFTAEFQRVTEVTEVGSYFTDAEGIFRANPEYDWSADTRVNADGFRSIPFAADDSDATSVLFLGDSFTWGAAAQPLTRSFVDLVGAQRYVCFNGGIPGTDPEQYARVGEKWIPRLQPDVVGVMVFMGNDIHCDLSAVEPHQALWYVTNAGWIKGHSADGTPLPTAADAYRHYLGRYNRVNPLAPGGALGLLRRVAMKSAAGTLAWVAGEERWWPPPAEAPSSSEERQALKLARGLALRDRLKRISAAAASVNARLLVFLIPVRPSTETSTNRIAGNDLLFLGFEPRVPAGLIESDYGPGDGIHFNNAGHRKFSEFVCEVLATAE